MALFRADSSVQYIKGVGPARAQMFATLGIHTVGDLLHYYPFRHEEDRGETLIEDLQPGTTATIRGEVVRMGGRQPSIWADLDDGTGLCRLRWFNLPYGGKGVFTGATVVAQGRVQIYGDRAEMVQPRTQVYERDAVLATRGTGPKQVGVYRQNQTVKSPLIRRAVQTVLLQAKLPIDEILPASLLKKRTLPDREQAVRQMHAPQSEKALDAARRRLAYEELFLMELAMALRRRKRLSLQSGQKLAFTPEIDARIRARFPFTLTASQDQAAREIVADLTSGRPMTRLLQGDVGSGKTVVALYACLMAVASKRQAAIMAPTEILAHQHYNNIARYLADSRVRYVLLRGGMPKKERAAALAAIERGEIDLVVGTQALIQKDVAFNQLAVVVVDEQHKFGVLQRHEFRTKGPMPHYLVMTATPIPRTLAMTVFGDLDVSILKHSPPGRGKIITKVVTVQQWLTVMNYVRGRLEKGEQAYVVCPVIGEGDAPEASPDENADPNRADPNRDPDDPSRDREGADIPNRDRKGASAAAPPIPVASARRAIGGDTAASRGRRKRGGARSGGGRSGAALLSVAEAWQHLTDGPWAGLNVGLLHGGMRPAEKNRIIGDFAAGKLHAVVSTTVVEVGVDVPNATIMIVEHAERYGLSQLHQLRGRVGRGSRDSLCVLIAHGRAAPPRGALPGALPPETAGKAAERLAVMARTTDGFAIAEADLRQRGPGQLFGTRQHGLPELHVASIVDDFAIVEMAREDAFQLAAADPTLSNPENRALLPALKRMFGEKLALIDAA